MKAYKAELLIRDFPAFSSVLKELGVSPIHVSSAVVLKADDVLLAATPVLRDVRNGDRRLISWTRVFVWDDTNLYELSQDITKRGTGKEERVSMDTVGGQLFGSGIKPTLYFLVEYSSVDGKYNAKIYRANASVEGQFHKERLTEAYEELLSDITSSGSSAA